MMDSQRFDEITKALATGVSRRAILRRLGAGLTGLGLAAAVRGSAEAAPPQKHCKFEGYGCRNNSICCSNNCCNRTCCDDGQDCCGGECHNACPVGEIRDETCACVADSGGPPTGCPPGTTDCGGTCVDLSSDEANCGACGNECVRNAVCASGACVCPAGTSNCTQGEGGCCLPGQSCGFGVGCCANNAVACDADTPCCSSVDDCGGIAAPGVCCRTSNEFCSSTTVCCNGPCNTLTDRCP